MCHHTIQDPRMNGARVTHTTKAREVTMFLLLAENQDVQRCGGF